MCGVPFYARQASFISGKNNKNLFFLSHCEMINRDRATRYIYISLSQNGNLIFIYDDDGIIDYDDDDDEATKEQQSNFLYYIYAA